jgi:WW domain-containing oxidoreductase
MSDLSAFDKTSTAEDVTASLDLSGQTWLVTGCNSGLGYETTRVLAMRGAHVIGLARTAEKASAAFDALGITGTAVACDLGDLATVRTALKSVTGLAMLDGIIANAGIMALPKLQQIHGYERQFFVNHIGHFVLITGLIDRLTESARVVMLSSAAHRYADRGIELDNVSGEDEYHPWRMYGRSKLANILFARSLATRFEGTARTANSLHPGVIKTNLARHVPNPDKMFEQLKPMMKSVPQGAATQCYVATRPELADVSGKYFSDCGVVDASAPGADDDAVAEALWVKSEEIVAAL